MVEIPRDERAVSDEDFFAALDLERKDLSRVRRAVAQGRWAVAREAIVEHFRTRPRPRWFFDLPAFGGQASGRPWRHGRRGDMPCFWVSPMPLAGEADYNREALRRAEEILQNKFRLAGDLLWDLGPELRWRTRVLRGLASEASVFKRCNFLRDLAIAYAKTGKRQYVRKFDELVRRWLADWPLVVDADYDPTSAVLSRPDGHKAMPTAFRVITWLDCLYSGILFAPEVSTGTAFRLIKSMWFTALQYRRYANSPYVPANHDLWEKGVAPFVFGVLLPEFPEVARLVAQGRPVIAAHAERSFLPDGGYEERSLGYTQAALTMFFLALATARRNRVRFLSRENAWRVQRCAERTAMLTLPDGSLPDIGDGHAYSLLRNAHMLGNSIELFNSLTAASVVRKLGLEPTLSAGAKAALKKSKSRPLPMVVHMPDSGYFVARDGWRRDASAMVLSVPGEGLPNHAHDDVLSLQLVVRGEQMIGTPLSELYNLVHQAQYKNLRLSGHFYAMTSHNLVLVAGEPAHPLEPLMGKYRVQAAPVEAAWEKTPTGVRIAGSHSAYPGVRLVRKVVFDYGKRWTVTDEVRGAAAGPHKARWHFNYGVEVIRQGNTFLARKGEASLVMRFSTPGRIRRRLYRDWRWLGQSPLRPGEPAPWVLEVIFGGTGNDRLDSVFEILKPESKMTARQA